MMSNFCCLRWKILGQSPKRKKKAACDEFLNFAAIRMNQIRGKPTRQKGEKTKKQKKNKNKNKKTKTKTKKQNKTKIGSKNETKFSKRMKDWLTMLSPFSIYLFRFFYLH